MKYLIVFVCATLLGMGGCVLTERGQNGEPSPLEQAGAGAITGFGSGGPIGALLGAGGGLLAGLVGVRRKQRIANGVVDSVSAAMSIIDGVDPALGKTVRSKLKERQEALGIRGDIRKILGVDEQV